MSGDRHIPWLRKIEKKNQDAERRHLQVLSEFAKAILIGEERIDSAPGQQRETAFGYLVSFLMSFASRSGTRDRLQIFTTNYDRLIEAGAEIAGLHLLDRFIGDLSPIFRSSRLNIDMHYNPPGIRGEPRYLEGVALFTKLHGSMGGFMLIVIFVGLGFLSVPTPSNLSQSTGISKCNSQAIS